MPIVPATQEANEGDLWSLEFKSAVSYGHATALQPGRQSGTLSLKKTKKTKKREKKKRKSKRGDRKNTNRLGAVAHACNPSTLGG